MRFEQLNHLLFAVHYGSVTRAAEALFITQSALSQSISRLEEELGVQLLVRTKMGVEATPDCHFFLEKSRLVVDALEEMRREAAKLAENSKMRIGTVKGLHLNFLMPAFLSFKSRFPHLSFEYEDRKRCLCTTQLNSITVLNIFRIVYELHGEPSNPPRYKKSFPV